jgi:hypothetical protein
MWRAYNELNDYWAVPVMRTIYGEDEFLDMRMEELYGWLYSQGDPEYMGARGWHHGPKEVSPQWLSVAKNIVRGGARGGPRGGVGAAVAGAASMALDQLFGPPVQQDSGVTAPGGGFVKYNMNREGRYLRAMEQRARVRS